MTHALYLAWRYLAFHRVKTTILVGSITLIVFLPVGLRVLVGQSAEQLTRRAQATPLIVGAKGSPLELVLNTLYFRSDTPEATRFSESRHIADSGLGRAIPLYVRFRARGYPIVGTTLEYFEFRGLTISAGRNLALLGECVLGQRVAQRLGVGPGDTLVSSPESVFDIAGVYPLKMRIVGVLAPHHTPDDESIFVDLKTAWIIEGLGHGHQNLAADEARAGVLRREGDTITANASVVQYNEIDPGNADSFHFHGDLSDYPVSAVIAVPPDAKSAALLQGRYQADEQPAQIVRPREVMDELLDTILTVQSFVIAAVLVVGLSTLATALLVFLLSLRLRRREIETIVKIGGARARVVSVLALEIVVVLGLATALAGGLTALTRAFGSTAIRALLLS